MSRLEELSKDPIVQEFMEDAKSRDRFRNSIFKLTSRCWDVCMEMEKPSSTLDKNQETCLANCVHRFIDTTLFVVDRVEEIKKVLENNMEKK